MLHFLRLVLASFSLCLVTPTLLLACLWDYDTVQMERQRFPSTLELITGKFLRHTGTQTRSRSLDREEKVEIYRADPKECAACPLKAKCCPQSKSGRSLNRSEHEKLIEEHRRKMEQPEAKNTYKLRRQTVEPNFGDSKEHRGLRRFRGRGLLRTKVQVGLTVLAHNIRQLVGFLVGAGAGKNET